MRQEMCLLDWDGLLIGRPVQQRGDAVGSGSGLIDRLGHGERLEELIEHGDGSGRLLRGDGGNRRNGVDRRHVGSNINIRSEV